MSDVPLITGTSSLDLLTEAGLSATAPLTISSRPFFWQQIERIRAALAICDSVAAIRHARVTLTNAQIKALPTTPVTLISAPGSGQAIVPISAMLFNNKTAGAYTNVNTTYCGIAVYWLGDFTTWALAPIVNDSTTSPALVRATDFLTGADKRLANLGPYNDSPATTPNGWVVPLAPISTIYENKALAIAADNNGSSNFTGGNAANSLQVDIFYTIATAP